MNKETKPNSEFIKCTEGVTGWGGHREGAGRPSTGRKRKFYYVTDQEDVEIKKLLQQLREG